MNYTKITGGVTAAKGFLAGGVHVGVKSSNKSKKDVCIIVSTSLAAVGGVFTQNKFAAAPVEWCRQVVAGGVAKAIVANSGCANACTGALGLTNAETMADLAAVKLGAKKEQILVASTGVIGHQLPMEKIQAGITKAAESLSESGGSQAAEAIMTTDTYAKESALQYEYEGNIITIGGIAKGSGMIHPNMATMFAFITTDAAIEPACLQKAVKAAADKSFNMVTVDQDTSTNDTMLVLANGQAKNKAIKTEDQAYQVFVDALTVVAIELAKMIAHDGEGATKFLEVQVQGAKTETAARLAAKAVVSSTLVKTAFFGEDANWGRIICAVGNSEAELDPEKVDIWLESKGGKEKMMASGASLVFDEAKTAEILKERDIKVLINMNDGPGAATAWGCDLSYDYVKINADYRT